MPIYYTLHMALKNVKLCEVVANSYGAMTVIMRFLDEAEKINLQQLDCWWYFIGVGRI